MSIGHTGCIASSVNQSLPTLVPFIPSLRYPHLKPPIRPVDEGIAITQCTPLMNLPRPIHVPVRMTIMYQVRPN